MHGFLLALCFWFLQIYNVLSGLSPNASLGLSLSEGENSQMGNQSRQTPKFGRLLFRENVLYAYICHLPFSISHRKIGECLDFLNTKALHDILFRVCAVTEGA